MRIPFLLLQPQHDAIRRELDGAFARLMDRQAFIRGEECRLWEEAYARYCGVGHCVGVGNGMDAILLSLKALGISPGHEVLVPALTCTPTWLGVLHAGAIPVPVDADPETWCMDLARLEAAITPSTRAIVPVHLYGRPERMKEITELAASHRIPVVEDNAQGHGAMVNGKKTGGWGIVNATSYYPTKNLGALGDGGAVTTDDEGLAEKVRIFSNYGMRTRFYHEEPGINSRLDEWQAAVLQIKLSHLDAWNAQRRKLAAVYDERLKSLPTLQLPVTPEGTQPVYHLYVVRAHRRDELRKHLEARGIGTDIHYPYPPHQQPFSALRNRSFPVTEKICSEVVSLPLWPGMTEAMVHQVADEVASFYR